MIVPIRNSYRLPENAPRLNFIPYDRIFKILWYVHADPDGIDLLHVIIMTIVELRVHLL